MAARRSCRLGPIQRLNADEEADMKREEMFARQLYKVESLPLTVTWRFARPAGLVRNQPPTDQVGHADGRSARGLGSGP